MLTPDMVLGRTVSYGNSILIRAGMKGLNHFSKKLSELGINYLYVEDKLSKDIDIEDVVSENTRFKCKTALVDIMEKMNKEFTVDSRLVTNLVESLMEDILNHSKTLLSLSAIDYTDESTLNHSINTTIYAICLGMEWGYNQQELLELAEGTVLHDLGKTVIKKSILTKPGHLDKVEFDHMKKHSSLGYDLLKKVPGLSERSKQIALYHHERMDGSGYPKCIIGAEIPEFARITAIVDVFEALTAERCYHKALSPYQATEILIADSADKLDLEMTGKFLQNIAIYPNGTHVYLSDGTQGIVKSQNPSMPLRPVVRIFQTEGKTQVAQKDVDLLNVLNLTIEEKTDMG